MLNKKRVKAPRKLCEKNKVPIKIKITNVGIIIKCILNSIFLFTNINKTVFAISKAMKEYEIIFNGFLALKAGKENV